MPLASGGGGLQEGMSALRAEAGGPPPPCPLDVWAEPGFRLYYNPNSSVRCKWCHVLWHDSWMDEQVAQIVGVSNDDVMYKALPMLLFMQILWQGGC